MPKITDYAKNHRECQKLPKMPKITKNANFLPKMPQNHRKCQKIHRKCQKIKKCNKSPKMPKITENQLTRMPYSCTVLCPRVTKNTDHFSSSSISQTWSNGFLQSL